MTYLGYATSSNESAASDQNVIDLTNRSIARLDLDFGDPLGEPMGEVLVYLCSDD